MTSDEIMEFMLNTFLVGGLAIFAVGAVGSAIALFLFFIHMLIGVVQW